MVLSGTTPAVDLADPSFAQAIAEAHELSERTLFLRAWQRLQGLGEIESWTDVDAICVGARVLRHLGATDRARRICLRAYRRHPNNAKVRFWAAFDRLEARGPHATWQWMGEFSDEGPPEDVGLLFGIRASLATLFRDFTTAQRWIEEGQRLLPDEAWFPVLSSQRLEAADRYDEAMEQARRGYRAEAPDRLVVHQIAHLLDIADRPDEAIALLEDTSRRTESASIALELARLQRRAGRWDHVWRWLSEYERLSPLLDDDQRLDLAGMRYESAYRRGDRRRAAQEARRSKKPLLEKLADRIDAWRPEHKEQTLDVHFVRQHHLTCVPACLTMLARYFDHELSHFEVAQRICYDGTSAYAERAWAEQEGWVARELTVTWAAARALIDRGIPFVVNTVEAVSAHAQLIVGYDDCRRTFTIRDPFQADLIHAEADAFLDNYAAYGPRGFLILPQQRLSLLDGVDLPEAPLHDRLHHLQGALERHARELAHDHLTSLEEQAPDHALTLAGRRALAAYDASPQRMLEVARASLERFPKEPLAELSLAGMSREAGRPEQALAHLESVCARDEVHPVFLQQLAAALLDDGREHERAGRLLRKALKSMPQHGPTVASMARWFWDQRRFERALELMRFATCADSTREDLAQIYFQMMHARGRSSEALILLKHRAAHYETASSGPALTLFSALETLELVPEAFELLERARQARPEDAELALFTAEARARCGQLPEAEAALRHAEPQCSRAAYLRAAATVSNCRGDVDAALEHLRELCDLQPLALDAQQRYSAMLATLRGATRAREHVLKLTADWPENATFAALLCQHSLEEHPDEQLAAVQRLIELEPRNAWAFREQALILARVGRSDEARNSVERAKQLAPNHPSTEAVAGRVYELIKDLDAARAAYRSAVREHPDESQAILRLFALTSDPAKLAALIDQTEHSVLSSVTGEGVQGFYLAVARSMTLEQLDTRVQRILAARRDLWSAWTVAVRVALESGKNAVALRLAKEAAERFPLIPGALLDLGTAYRALGSDTKELSALERAVAINPSFTEAVLELVGALRRAAEPDRAEAALERGLRFRPLDGQLWVTRAELAWQRGQTELAFDYVERALTGNPSFEPAWDRLNEWAADSETRQRIVGKGRELWQRCHWDARIAVRLAELVAQDDPVEAIELVKRATEVDAEFEQAHDLLAVLQARMGRRDAALAACAPAALAGRRPVSLAGREAWVHGVFGDPYRAIAEMQKLLSQNPRYTWGLWQLANWCLQIEDIAGARAALARLRESTATDALLHLHAAELLEDLDDVAAAEDALRRALTIEPSLSEAALALISLLTRLRRGPEVQAVHARYAGHLSPYGRLLADAMLAFASNRPDPALELCKAAWTHPTATRPTRAALAHVAMDRAPWIAVEALYDASVTCNAEELGEFWYNACLVRGRYPTIAQLKRLLLDAPEAGAGAAEQHFWRYAETGNLSAIPDALLMYRIARERPRVLAAVGHALERTRVPYLCRLWYRGTDLAALAPEALLPLARSLRAHGSWQEAMDVCQVALAAPRDGTVPTFQAMLAFELALQGRGRDAQTLLAAVEPTEVNEQERCLHSLTLALSSLDTDRQETVAAAVAAIDAVTADWVIVLHRQGGSLRRMSRSLARRGASVKSWVRGYSMALLLSAFVLLAMATVFLVFIQR